jgi:aquaporin Z
MRVTQAWVMELFWTFFLVYIILTVCSPELKEFCQYYAMGIGFLVVMGAFAAGPFSAAVFNPAVGIAVCFAAKSAKIWIYFVRPPCVLLFP